MLAISSKKQGVEPDGPPIGLAATDVVRSKAAYPTGLLVEVKDGLERPAGQEVLEGVDRGGHFVGMILERIDRQAVGDQP